MLSLRQQLRKISKEQYIILKDFSKYSKNLYNYTLYVANEYYKQTGKYIGYIQLDKETRSNENYKLLPSQCAQQIIRLVDKNFRSFFVLINKSKRGEYTNKVNLPKYKKKDSYFNIIYTFQNCILSKGILTLFSSKEYIKLKGKNIKLKIPFTYNIDGKIKQVIIKPINNCQYFEMIIQYEENKKIDKQNENVEKKYLGIDLGLNNLMSCYDSGSGHSFIMNGRPLKSYNQQFNEIKSKIQSELKTRNDRSWSRKLQIITTNRRNYIDNYFNQCVSIILNYCLDNNITDVVVGYNQTWKNEINIGRINNRMFTAIPHLTLINKLSNKLMRYSINLVHHEESYTSKCSFLDKEKLGKNTTYMGKRSKRGLFRTAKGILMNADINGAANIVRKVVGDAIYDGQPVMGMMLRPVKLNPLTMNLVKLFN